MEQKRGRRNKDFKKEASRVKGWVPWKGECGSWNPLTNYDNLKNNFMVSRSSYVFGVNRTFSVANAFFAYKKYNQKLHVKYYDGK